ncbi:BTAD domain-containing putative transcriptional regulator [Nocardia arizonensis]|uniref:BTAD domain-containing putative transcriptional regulator n=1 Tax=Nocardia arizonensis TaxID=1141647 RepID=UPI000A9A4450|nr:BTAD domain-containing putative transcriptional regulator [Nocardia arizonensis]
MEFEVLGALRVRDGDRELTIGSATQRRLLAALLVHAGTVLSADRLIAVAWGEDPPPSALRSLHTYLSRLRTVLHRDGAEILLTRPPGYLLDIAPDQLDATRFHRLVEAARITGDPADFESALGLWRGAAYAEFADSEFARAEAVRLEQARLVAREDSFEAALGRGHDGELVAAIEVFTAEHPLRERPHALLMRALYNSGRHADALAVFRRFRQRLDGELGVAPSATLRALESAILRQELDVVAPTAHPVSVPASSRLPSEPTPLIGRADDEAAIRTALTGTRLLTLTGVGGVGKTRLALHVATRRAGDYPDGVRWCELAPLTDGAAVAHALAAALGARRGLRSSLEQAIIAFLAPKKLLLVLDNCEHVIEDSARLVDRIVRACPNVTVMTTSRIPLGVPGEHLYPTAPLPFASDDSPAARLFIDRAKAVRPDLVLTQDNRRHIAELCRRLDGLPLGIELAAARVRSINPADLSERSRTSFALFTSSRTTTAPRHRTLRAVVDWSYALLSPAAQRLFARLSVFSGGFSLDAAEAVCSEGDLVDLITSLVDSSLITAGGTTATRYTMLETLRAFGREQLDNRDETDATHHRHAVHFADLATAAERGLRGPDEARWISTVDHDLDNLRAAHHWAVGRRDTDLTLRISAGLYHYALYQFPDEVISWGETALRLPGADSHPLYTVVCAAVAEGFTFRGAHQRARAIAESALARGGIGDRDRIPLIKILATVALYEGRLGECFSHATEQLALAGIADPWYQADALLFQTLSSAYADDTDRADAIADRHLRVAHRIGTPSLIAWAEYGKAEALSRTAPDRAVLHYQRAVATADGVDSVFVVNVATVGLAALYTRTGATGSALRAFRAAILGWRRMQVWHHQWTTLRNLGRLLVELHLDEPAAVLLGVLHSAHAEVFGADASHEADSMRILRERLGESAFEAARARGMAMTGEAAVEFALATIDHVAVPD